MIRKRAIKKVAPVEGQYLSNLFLVGKKVGKPSNDKHQRTKRFNLLYSFQNGGYAYSKRIFSTKRLNVRNRSKKCIL